MGQPETNALVQKVPVLDIHTHTFNARDLPFWSENLPEVQFRICHMMNMAPTYAQPEGDGNLHRFEQDVIPAMENLQ